MRVMVLVRHIEDLKKRHLLPFCVVIAILVLGLVAFVVPGCDSTIPEAVCCDCESEPPLEACKTLGKQAGCAVSEVKAVGPEYCGTVVPPRCCVFTDCEREPDCGGL